MGRTDHKGKHFKKEPETREEFETPDMPQSSDRPRRMVGFKRLGFQALPEFWTFQFVAGSLLSFVLGLAGSATNALVGSLGAPITSANLSQFVATWQGILILLLWLVLLPIAVAVEVFAGVYACNDVLYGRPVKVRSDLDKTGEAEIVLRPEAIEIADRGQIPCKVELSCFMGSYQNYHVRVGDTLVKIADNCPIGRKTFQVGDDAFISFRSECSHLLET